MVLLAVAGEPAVHPVFLTVMAGPLRGDSDPVVDFSPGGMSLWLLENSFASSGPLVGFWFWNVNDNIQEPVKSQWLSICLRLFITCACGCWGHHDLWFPSQPAEHIGNLQSPVWDSRQLSSVMLGFKVWLFCGSCGFVSGLSYQLSWKV